MREWVSYWRNVGWAGLSIRYHVNGDDESEGENPVGVWGKGVPGGGWGKLDQRSCCGDTSRTNRR